MAIEASSSPRLLIVRRDNIGDLVCTTPLIAALRERLPRAWIAALVNSYNSEVLARNPALDEVFVYEKLKHRTQSLVSNFTARAKLSVHLRKARLDYVLVPAATPRTIRLAASYAPHQILAAYTPPDDRRHEVERSFALGESLGVTGRPGPLRIYPDAETVRALRERLGSGPFTAVHISARRPAQRWPVKRWSELIRELGKHTQVMLLWAPGPANDPRHPGDDDKAARLAENGVASVRTPDLCTLIAALSLADKVICPDGGAMHIAAALAKPTVALFGDSPVERWSPWQVRHRILRSPSANLADVEVAAVLQAHAELTGSG
jgi:ADP-heptose:LPS heptosyltransferase